MVITTMFNRIIKCKNVSMAFDGETKTDRNFT